MRTPRRHPGHAERVGLTTRELAPGHTHVVARCSCCPEPLGDPHPLDRPGAAAALAGDFNAHRATYVAAA